MNIRFIIERWELDYQAIETIRYEIDNDVTLSLALNEQATIVDLLYYLNKCNLIVFSKEELQPFDRWIIYRNGQKLEYFSTIKECGLCDGDTLRIEEAVQYHF